MKTHNKPLCISFYSANSPRLCGSDLQHSEYDLYEYSDESPVFQKFVSLGLKGSVPCSVIIKDDEMRVISGTKEVINSAISSNLFDSSGFCRREDAENILKGCESVASNEDKLFPCIAADSTEVQLQYNSGKLCQLSIRLMDSSILREEFSENQSLLDVKRWLQKHDIIPTTPQDDELISNYVQIGYLEKFRYAFFSPSSRHTFTESEELLRLKDIGLTSRVSLILRPDYDPTLQSQQVGTDIKNTWRLTSSRILNVLQALYQFFDYGVDEAQKDLQDFTDSLDHKDYGTPHFLGTAPSTGSLVNITAARRPLESPIGRVDPGRERTYQNIGSRAGTPSVQMTETSVTEEGL